MKQWYTPSWQVAAVHFIYCSSHPLGMLLSDKHSALERDTTLHISYRVLMMQSLESVCEGGTSGLQLVKKPALYLSRTILLMQGIREHWSTTLNSCGKGCLLSAHQHMYKIMYKQLIKCQTITKHHCVHVLNTPRVYIMNSVRTWSSLLYN